MALFSSRRASRDAKLKRRVFLSALGAGVGASLAWRFAGEATAAPLGRVPRLFIYFVPHGVPVEHHAVTGAFDLAESGIGVWSGLNPYKDQLIIPQGIENQVMNNHDAIRSTLSGADGSADSIDAIIAQTLGLQSHVLGAQPRRALSVGVDADAALFRQGAYVAPEENPAAAWDLMFGSAQDAQTQLDARSAALSLSEAQLERLRTDLGTECSDANGLSEHLSALSELKARSSRACASEAELSIAMNFRSADPMDPDLFASVLQGQLGVAAQGMICGASQIVGLQCLYAHTQLTMDFAGGPGFASYHHDPLSHGSDPTWRENFASCQKWFIDQLATYLVAQLDQPDPLDARHTVLENSTILFVTEVADGFHHHTAHQEVWLNGGSVDSYMPWFLLGGGCGTWNTGRVASFTNQDHRDLLATVASVMGVSVSQIAGHDVTVLSELLA